MPCCSHSPGCCPFFNVAFIALERLPAFDHVHSNKKRLAQASCLPCKSFAKNVLSRPSVFNIAHLGITFTVHAAMATATVWSVQTLSFGGISIRAVIALARTFGRQPKIVSSVRTRRILCIFLPYMGTLTEGGLCTANCGYVFSVHHYRGEICTVIQMSAASNFPAVIIMCTIVLSICFRCSTAIKISAFRPFCLY